MMTAFATGPQLFARVAANTFPVCSGPIEVGETDHGIVLARVQYSAAVVEMDDGVSQTLPSAVPKCILSNSSHSWFYVQSNICQN